MTVDIQDKLNALFEASDSKARIIYFWYDEKGEYKDVIQTYSIENAKLQVLTDNNLFATKVLIEYQDRESNYLIYAPFKKPEDSENLLADIYHYARPFSADTASLLISELELPASLRPLVTKYDKFLGSKERRNKLRKYLGKILTDDDFELSILAAICSVEPGFKFSDILAKVIVQTTTDNKSFKEIETYGLTETFWNHCSEFGYVSKEPNLTELIRTLFVTDLYQNIDIPEKSKPIVWKSYTVPHPENVPNIIYSIRKVSTNKEAYQKLADEAIKALKPEQTLDLPVSSYLKCDTFEYFNLRIISYLTRYLVDNKLPYPKEFRKNYQSYHTFYGEKYKPVFELLCAAAQLIALTNKTDDIYKLKEMDEIITSYLTKWSTVDWKYRMFYEKYDLISQNNELQEVAEHLSELRELIEVRYKKYLEVINVQWTETLSKKVKSLDEVPGLKQHDFYQKCVLEEINKHGTTAVIISDGFRLEIARELESFINNEKKNSISVNPMLSSLPSITSIGKSALLPFDSFTIDNDLHVTLDGINSGTTETRQTILQKYTPKSIAVTYNDLKNSNRTKIRELLKDVELIYIYHDSIDVEGEHTEDKVFEECRTAIKEITYIINKLTGDKSITNYIVTSDHGFLYLRNKIDESAKIKLSINESDKVSRRYIVGTKPYDNETTVSFPLDYLGKDTAGMYVTVPYGIDLFKSGKGGVQYTHGGLSLQESLIPVAIIKTRTEKVERETAKIVLRSKTTVTSINEYIEFIQKDPVGDQFKASEKLLYFVDESGNKISKEVIIEDVDSQVTGKEFRKKFTLTAKSYNPSVKYYLIIKDNKTEIEEARIPYNIDIAFSPLF